MFPIELLGVETYPAKSARNLGVILKKLTLNRDDMKNYRPVSNLSFLSKILEKVVASRLNSHINSSHTSNDYQSAYRKFHSTEKRSP